MFAEEFFGFGIVFPLAFLAIIALAIVAVATGRAEPDPDGRRAYGFYLSVVGVVTVLLILFAATDAVGNVVAALVEEDEVFEDVPYDEGFYEGDEFVPVPDEFPADDYDPDDDRYSNAVRSGLLALSAFAVYWFHRRRIGAVEEESRGRDRPAWRVHYGYLLAVAFLGVVTLLAAASDALFGVFRAIAPGITGFGGDHSVERRSGLTELLRSGVLAAAAAFVFQHHWRRSQTIATPEPSAASGANGPTADDGEGPSPATPPS